MSSPEDDIQDDSSDAELKDDRLTQEQPETLTIRKRPLSHDIGGFFTASQKFRKGSGEIKISPATLDGKSWTDKYKPNSLDELGVHKKKVSDVRNWLERSFAGRSYQSLLVLKGPAGAGKTSTLSALSQVIPFEIIEWRNPDIGGLSSDGSASFSIQFEEFLHKSRKYGSLHLFRSDRAIQENPSSSGGNAREERLQQISLVEEFPNTLSSLPGAADSFRSTILQYLSMHVTHIKGAFSKPIAAKPANPLVLIISESSTSSSTASADSFTAHRLLGPDIINHPATTVVEFNAVAPTIIAKALNLILQKHFRSTGKRYSPSVQVMQELSEIGDIRNATSTLDFYCKQTEDLSGRLTVSSKKAKSGAKTKVPRKMPSNASPDPTVSLIAHRDSTLSLFHAVGKVVYNKRVGTSLSTPEPPVPPHLVTKVRPHPSENDPSTLLTTAGTDISTFLASLHENYVLSCYDPSGDAEASLDCVNDCIDMLSHADVLSSSLNGTATNYSRQPTSAIGTSEAITQAELAFHVGVRGLLFGLPHPVKRPAALPGQHTRDANRMFYPISLKIWRRQEELGGLLDVLVAQHYTGRLYTSQKEATLTPSSIKPANRPTSSSNPLIPISTPVSSSPVATAYRPETKAAVAAASSSSSSRSVLWTRPRPLQAAQTPPTPPSTAALETPRRPDSDSNVTVALGSGSSAAREMLLERLPYLAQIMRATKRPAVLAGVTLRDIEQVTRFSGQDVRDEEEESDQEGEGGVGENSSWGTKGADGPVTGSSRGGIEERTLGELKLVISDDDIEDD